MRDELGRCARNGEYRICTSFEDLDPLSGDQATVKHQQRHLPKPSTERPNAVRSGCVQRVRLDDRNVAPVVVGFHRTIDGRNLHHAMAMWNESRADKIGQATNLDAQEHVHWQRTDCMRAS